VTTAIDMVFSGLSRESDEVSRRDSSPVVYRVIYKADLCVMERTPWAGRQESDAPP